MTAKQPTTIRLDADLHDQATERAAALGMSLSEWITQAMRHCLAAKAKTRRTVTVEVIEL